MSVSDTPPSSPAQPHATDTTGVPEYPSAQNRAIGITVYWKNTDACLQGECTCGRYLHYDEDDGPFPGATKLIVDGHGSRWVDPDV